LPTRALNVQPTYLVRVPVVQLLFSNIKYRDKRIENGYKIKISIYRHDPTGVKSGKSHPSTPFSSPLRRKKKTKNLNTKSGCLHRQSLPFHPTVVLATSHHVELPRQKRQAPRSQNTIITKTRATHSRPYTVHNVRDPRSSLELCEKGIPQKTTVNRQSKVR
jgi:hypothetical protein